MPKKFLARARGFTLIELVVVVSIIGFLLTVAIVSLKNSREKARDATRLSDLAQLKNVMEMYYNDNHGYPPATANGKIGVGGNIDTLLMPYMAKLPLDPLSASDSSSFYYYDASQPCNGGEYAAVAVVFASKMEKTSGNYAKICSVPWSGNEIEGEGSPNSYSIVIGPGQ